MPALDVVRDILHARDFNQLIGLKEDLFLEVKGHDPYNLAVPSGRYELAKDVSAFANSEGGYLLIGLTTVHLDFERTEEITALDLLPAANFSVARYEGVIVEYTYPKIDGFQVSWIEDIHTAGMGLGCICVPSQSEEKKLFLIAKVVEEAEQLKQIVFGMAQRKESSNDPLSVKDVYRMTQTGRNSTAQRLTGIDEKLDLLLEAHREQHPSRRSPVEDLDARIKKVVL